MPLPLVAAVPAVVKAAAVTFGTLAGTEAVKAAAAALTEKGIDKLTEEGNPEEAADPPPRNSTSFDY